MATIIQQAQVNKIIRWSVIGLVALVLLSSTFYTVDTQDRGIVSTFGKVDPEPVGDGLHLKIPFVQKVQKMSIQTKKIGSNASTYTKDIQSAEITYMLNYNVVPASVATLYANVGRDYENKIIQPIVLGALKDVVGCYVAADIVANRDAVRHSVEEAIRAEMAKTNYFENVTIQITNIDYDDKFESSIVEKQVAEQKALTAKNNTIRIQEEANQQVIAAKAEAEAIRIKAQAMASNPKIVEYEAVLKWDGKLPTYNGGGALPFINVK